LCRILGQLNTEHEFTLFSKFHVMFLSAVTPTMLLILAIALVLVLVTCPKNFLSYLNHVTVNLLNDSALWIVQYIVSVCDIGDMISLIGNQETYRTFGVKCLTKHLHSRMHPPTRTHTHRHTNTH